MTRSTWLPDARPDSPPPNLTDVVDEITDLLNRGEAPDLDQYAAGDPQVRSQLERIVATLMMLREPVESSDEPATLSPLATLGDFRLIREIGRGGMGVVYEAEQLSLDRRMALKVLPLAGTLDGQQLQRFKNEARMAAGLKHPHIVSVHSVGVERGVHYYAMELIEGRSLAQAISQLSDETRKTSEQPAKSTGESETSPVAALSTACTENPREYFRHVARLISDAADALEYAHQQGIVHRDVKPGNLLLDGEQQIYVADFGLARLETDVGATLTGDILGTLRYMSPEQAAGQPAMVDHRTDVHALGATLYEMLALRHAFSGNDRATLLRQIANDEPPKLRQVKPQIPGDLETIVGKAMAKDPIDRYQSAGELAADLRAFLEDRPIVARPPTLATRAQKSVRRHSRAVAALVVVLTLGILGASVSAAMLGAANRRVVAERNEAKDNLLLAAEAVDSLLAEMGQVAKAHGELVQAERFLAEAERFYQRLIAKSNDPEVLRRAARAYNRMAELEQTLGRHERALERRQAAIKLLDRLADDQWLLPNVEVERAVAYAGLGRAYSLLFQDSEGEKYYNLSREIWLRLLSQEPNNPRYLEGLSELLNSLGGVYANRGRLVEAQRAFERSLKLSEQLPTADEHDPQRKNTHAGIACNLGVIAAERGNLAKAERLFRKAVAMQREVTQRQPKLLKYRRDLWLFHWNLADLLVRQGDYAGAVDTTVCAANEFAYLLEAQVECARLLLRCARGVEQGDAGTIRTGQHDGAEIWRQRARQLISEATPTSDTSLDELGRFGWFLVFCTDESFRDADRALRLANRGLSELPERRFLRQLSGVALYRLEEYETAIKTLEGASNGGVPDVIESLFIAMSYWKLGRPQEAREWRAKAIKLKSIQETGNLSTYDFLAATRQQAFAEANAVLESNDDASSPNRKSEI